MILTLESLKTAINALKASFVKPNWNENDSSKKGYIENRPFYEENGLVLKYKNSRLDFSNGCIENELTTMFVENNTYIVDWNGTKYECLARNDGWDDIYIGNQQLGDDWEFPEIIESNEPFFIATYEEDNWSQICSEDTSANITIYEDNTTIHKIDEKFLPEQKPATLLVTCNDDMGTFDKSFSEILEAYNNGQIVQAKIGFSTSIFTVVAVDSNEIVLATSSVIDNPGSNYYGDHDYSGRHFHIYSDGTYKLVDSALLKKKTNYSALKTTDKTVFGAINEVNSKFTDGVDALILSSPNGTRFQITVGDDGVLTATEITEVN